METSPKAYRISARGKNETFAIFSVCEKRKTADLKSVTTPGHLSYLLQDVPWTDIS